MDIIKICALGGLDESGRDCHIIEINNDIFVIDLGASLPDKTLPGVDFVIPNPEYLVQNKDRVKAYIMTHGHDENTAGLKYVYDNAPAPIYCTSATKNSLLSQAAIHHVKQHFNFVEVPASSDVNIAGRQFHFFQTAHNYCYSFGVAIETDRGNIIYSSDFIIDYSISNPAYIFDMNKLIEISNKKPTLLLMSESKTADRPGYCSPKHRIYPLVNKYFNDNKRIFICCFWQNMYRISEIARMVHENHKRVYLYNKYTRDIMSELMKADPNMFMQSDFIPEDDLLRVRAQDTVILMLGHGEELYEEMNALSRGLNADKRIVISQDDIFVGAAIATPTLETMATRAIDDIYRTGCSVIWLKGKDVTSMHAKEDDLKALLTLLKPKFYLPVRGNFVNMMANAKLALSTGIGLNHTNVFILDNGMQLIFDENPRPHIVQNETNKINIAPTFIDGKGITNVGSGILEDRKKLGVDGTVVVAVTVSKSLRQIVAGPDCQMRGFVYVKEAEPLLKSVSNILISEINTALKLPNPNFEDVKRNVEDRSRKFIKRENGREPYILPIIVEID